MKRKFYIVIVGRTPSIYETWEECKAQVHGFSRCLHKSFTAYEDAMLARNQHKATTIGRAVDETDGSRYVRASATSTMVDSRTCVAAPISPTIIGGDGPQDGNEEREGLDGPGNDPHIHRPLVGLLLGLFVLFAAVYVTIRSSG
ncbi:uncharacterized protein LOC131242362 [Magnolia sinica]|uniref:uncharacterized protein LOC131242362 n=1 Tax=Magnolia sinica TaxID=86752 RepID=UPI00265902F2|nr:uncharacterized protein LOC131242362 [Magnolia sinica]